MIKIKEFLYHHTNYYYFVDYSGFSYNRSKFKETLLDYVTIVDD